MYILSCGGWYVGNTAILEWLSNFEENYYLKGDFHELRVEGGIYDCIYTKDLKCKKRYIRNQIIHHVRGIVRATLKKLKLKSGKGHGYDFEYNLQMSNLLIKYYYKVINTSVTKRNWEVEYWSKSFQILKDKLDFNAQSLVLQNPIYYDDISPEHANIWRNIFIKKRMFFVTRDPIDQFIDIYLKDEFKYGETKFRAGTKGLDPVATFFKISKRTYLSRIKMLQEYKTSELAIISFEDFASMTPKLEYEMKLFFRISSFESKSFDFSFTKSNTNLKEIHSEIYQKIRPFRKELKELYDLKNRLDGSEFSLANK